MDRIKQQEFVRPRYPYARVEAALAVVFGVGAATQRGALRGRLKHLQRLGLPGLMAGKGTRVLYSHEQVCQWLVALLISELGTDPTVTVKLVQRQWPTLERRIRQARDSDALAGNPMLLVMQPRIMTAAWDIKDASPIWVDAMRRLDHHLKDRDGRPIPRENVSVLLDRDPDEWNCTRNLTDALGKLEAALHTESHK